jgi:hypothetical protein
VYIYIYIKYIYIQLYIYILSTWRQCLILRSSWFAQFLALIAVLVSAVNIIGGFVVSQRMLNLFKCRGRWAEMGAMGAAYLRGFSP